MLPRTMGTVRCLRGLGFGGGVEELGGGLRVGVLRVWSATHIRI